MVQMNNAGKVPMAEARKKSAPLGDITNILGGPARAGTAQLVRERAIFEATNQVQDMDGSLPKRARSQSVATTASTGGSGHSSTLPASVEALEEEEDDEMMMDNDDQDPQFCSEYADDVCRVLLYSERNDRLASPAYMTFQTDINARMRAILVDWLVEVQLKYKLKSLTLYLSVNILDRFLQVECVQQQHLQLVGVTCMLIASKFEEIYLPEVKDFVYICADAYTREDILDMEVHILNRLGFQLCAPTLGQFIDRYSIVNSCSEEHRFLLQYLVELTLPEVCMLKYPPSHLVASALWLSNKCLRKSPAWPPAMEAETGKKAGDVKVCAREICRILELAPQEEYESKAVYRKFSSSKLGKVALMRHCDP